MALNKISGLALQQLAEQAGQIVNFPTVQNALDEMQIIVDSNVIEMVLNALYINYSEGLTGGSKQGSVVVSSEQVEDAITSTVEGALTFVNPVDATGSIFNAIGLNVDFSKGALALGVDKVLNEVFGTSGITLDEFKSGLYKVPAMIKDGTTYLSNEVIQPILQKLIDNDVLTKEEQITVTLPNSNIYTQNDFTYLDCNSDNMFNLFLECLANAPFTYDGSSLENVKRAIETAFNNGYFNSIRGNYNQGFNKGWGAQFSICNPSAYNETHVQIQPYYFINANRVVVTKYDNYSSYNSESAGGTVYINRFNGNVSSGSSVRVPTGYVGFYGNYDGSKWYYGNTSGVNKILTSSYIEGINKQENSTTPNTANIETELPNWWATRNTINTLDKLGQLRPIEWLKTKLTLGSIEGDDIFNVSQADAQQGTNPASNLDIMANNANDLLPTYNSLGTDIPLVDSWTPSNNIPSSSGAPVVAPILPSITGQGLYTVYNPTQQELELAGAFLWGSAGIESILNIFRNNPLDAVIGLHMLYATPTTGESKHIIFGNADSNVSANLVTTRYIEINCGTINVAEVFGNATDYEPYTKCEIYLPFIGFNKISANDVVGGTLKVTYKVDTYTGACVAILEITKFGKSPILYTFEGNCSVDVPLTGTNRSVIMANAVRSAIGGMAISGGNPVGAIAGAGVGLLQPPSIMRSGSFTSNAGAMSIKKPYLVVSRYIPYDAENYNKLYGYPSNELVKLSTLTGFTRVKDVHVEGIACTDNEKILIENALKDGVLL